MIIEMFLLRGKDRKPESISCELTPETIAEEEILRSAKIIHKNPIMVWWGDTLEIGNVRGSVTQRKEEEEVICMDGLKVNFKLPVDNDDVVGYYKTESEIEIPITNKFLKKHPDLLGSTKFCPLARYKSIKKLNRKEKD